MTGKLLPGASLVAFSLWALAVESVWPSTSAAQTTATSQVAKYFDTQKTATIGGIIGGISHTTRSPYVFIVLAEVDKAGNHEMKWVIKGDTRPALERAGWVFGPGGTVRPGVTISARVYPARPSTNILESIPGAARELVALAKAGGLVHGLEITLPDGRKLYFGPAE